MGIESIHLNFNLNGVGHRDVFGMGGITGRRIVRSLGKP